MIDRQNIVLTSIKKNPPEILTQYVQIIHLYACGCAFPEPDLSYISEANGKFQIYQKFVNFSYI